MGQWLLKSPAHMWQLDKLLAEYPDAILVQTHRDPLVVISSISALEAHLQKLASDGASVRRAADQCSEETILGLERAMQMIDAGVVDQNRMIDQFRDKLEYYSDVDPKKLIEAAEKDECTCPPGYACPKCVEAGTWKQNLFIAKEGNDADQNGS